MRRIIVRYKTRPDRTEENARLIESVFEDLQKSSPDGIRYVVFRVDDGTFVHMSETEDGVAPLPEREAFRRFQSGVKERCIEPPQQGQATIVGNYRMLMTRETD